VHFIILTQHLEYLSDNGKVVGVKVCPCQLTEPDESGRRRAVAVENSSYTLDFDIIAEAIGQKSVEGLDVMLPGVELERGLVAVNDNCQTSIEKVFAGGDIVRGASSVVAAVADGMKAARQIDLLLKWYFSQMQEDRNPPLADAILSWIPAFAGMTGRMRHLAKVLPKM